jgi:hypothetical protein
LLALRVLALRVLALRVLALVRRHCSRLVSSKVCRARLLRMLGLIIGGCMALDTWWRVTTLTSIGTLRLSLEPTLMLSRSPGRLTTMSLRIRSSALMSSLYRIKSTRAWRIYIDLRLGAWSEATKLRWNSSCLVRHKTVLTRSNRPIVVTISIMRIVSLSPALVVGTTTLTWSHT